MRSAAKTQSAGDDKRWFCGRLLWYSMDCSVFRALRSFQAHTKITHRNKLSRCPAIECKAVTTRCQNLAKCDGPSELVIFLAITRTMPLGTSGVFRNLCLRDALEDRLWIAAWLMASARWCVCSWFPSSAVKSTGPGTVECCCAGTSSRWEAAVRSRIRHIGTLSKVLPHVRCNSPARTAST